MKSRISTFSARLAAVLLGLAMLPAHGGGGKPGGMPAFGDLDTDKDSYLSLEEFQNYGKDELAFKAADLNGDQRIDREEFARYQAKKASDKADTQSPSGSESGSGSGGTQ